MYQVVFLGVAGIGISVLAKQLYEALLKQEQLSNENNTSKESSNITKSAAGDKNLVVKDAPITKSKNVVFIKESRLSKSVQTLFDEDPTKHVRKTPSTWFECLNNQEDEILYLIFLNMECGLTEEQISDCVRKVNRRSQMQLKANDLATLEEWVATGKKVFAFRVSDEEILFELHTKARIVDLTRQMMGTGEVMVVLGLGPARIRELRDVV